MFNTPYYHGTIKKFITGFGALFSHVKIARADSAGTIQQTVNVPLAYAPKEKWAVRVDQDPELTNHIYSSIPRMGFEITGYSYDSTRMVNRNNTIKKYTSTNAVKTMYAPVPYNLEISLYAQTKGTEDGLTIVEQILPLFTPEYNMNVMVLPEMGITQNVPIILNNVSVQDDYEGDFATRRFVTHTFSFTAKLNLYGPIKTGGIITNTATDLVAPSPEGPNQHNAVGNAVTGDIVEGWN